MKNFSLVILGICILCLSILSVFSSPADSIRSLIDQTDNNLEKASLLMELGNVYNTGDGSDAITHYTEALKFATAASLSTNNKILSPEADIIIAQAYRAMAIEYSNQGDYSLAEENFNKSKSLYERLEILYSSPFRSEIIHNYAKLVRSMGINYSKQGIFSLAEDLFNQAVTLNEELGNKSEIASNINSLGIIEARRANLAGALEYFQKAGEIYQELKDTMGIAQAYNNMGGLQYQMTNWDEALEFFLLAEEKNAELGLIQNVAATKSNIGLTYINKNEYSKAETYLTESLEMRNGIEDKKGIVESYNNFGLLYTATGDYDRAIDYYNRSYELALQINDPRTIANSFVNLGKVYALQGNTHQAINSVITGLDVARENELNFIVLNALFLLSEYHQSLGDYRKAFDYIVEHNEVHNQILNEEKSRQITQLEVEYKARENQQRIEFLEQENQLNQTKLKQSQAFNFLISIVFIAVSIVGFLTFVILRQRNRISVLRKTNEAEKSVQKTYNDLATIVETHAHGIVLIDNDLNILVYNGKALEWFERFKKIELKNLPTIHLPSDPFLDELNQGLIQPALAGKSAMIDLKLSDNGTSRYFSLISNPVLDPDDNHVQSINLLIEDMTERKLIEDQMRSDIREKVTLIREIHHRVKNNMQVITSLIRMQSRNFTDENLQLSFTRLEQRISAMSFVHEDLYKSENLSDIRFDDYLTKISSHLAGLHGRGVQLETDIEMENELINIDLAMPCGLIINELVSNSLSHAFPEKIFASDRTKKISLLFKESNDHYELKLIDNGIGVKNGFDIFANGTMGLHLVKIIAEDQLRGELTFDGTNGFKVTIVFPKKTS